MCLLNIGTLVAIITGFIMTVDRDYVIDNKNPDAHSRMVDYTVYGFTFVFLPVTCIMLKHNIYQSYWNWKGKAYFFVMHFDSESYKKQQEEKDNT